MLPKASVSANRINEVVDTKPDIEYKKITKKFDPNIKGFYAELYNSQFENCVDEVEQETLKKYNYLQNKLEF